MAGNLHKPTGKESKEIQIFLNLFDILKLEKTSEIQTGTLIQKEEEDDWRRMDASVWLSV